jgi:hypothetical protein
MRILFVTMIGAVVLCAAATTGRAGSIGTAANILRATNHAGITENIAYRRCWWRHGVRYCRRYRIGYAPYYRAYPYGYSGSSIGVILGIQ